MPTASQRIRSQIRVRMSEGKRKFEAITPEARAKHRARMNAAHAITPTFHTTKYGQELRLEGMNFNDGMKVSREATSAGHPMAGTQCILKGSMDRNNFPHWPLYFSQGCPRMPIASKKIGMLAIQQCKLIWPDLTFNAPVDKVDKWPVRSLYMMHLTSHSRTLFRTGRFDRLRNRP